MKNQTLLAALLLTNWVAAAPIDELRALVEKGQATQAYQFGKKNSEQLGDPNFDLLYGIAAIDAGYAGEGVLALERYVLRFPDDASARLELGRGYYFLGDDARARDEFEAVAKLNPPATVLKAINRYLDAIRLREARYKTSSGAYLEAGLGYDSNVNGGVNQADIVLPVFGSISVIDEGVKKKDSYLHLALGGQINHPIAPGTAVFAALQADGKLHRQEDAFDLATVNLAAGASYYRNRNAWRGTFFHSELSLDRSRYRSLSGLSLDWRRQLDEHSYLSFAPQAARLNYQGENAVRDADFYALTVSYRRNFTLAWQPVLNVSGNRAREANRNANRSDLSRDITGGNIDVTFSPTPEWSVLFGAGYQLNQYDADTPLLFTTRRDRTTTLNLVAIYLLNKHWSLRADWQHIINRSNLELYDYTRDVLSIKLRYEFK